MSDVVVYLLGLPLAVVWLANVYSVIDEPERAHPLIRLLTMTCLILAALLVVGREYATPLLYALGTVFTLYVGTFYATRYLALGVPRYMDRPLLPSIESVEADDAAINYEDSNPDDTNLHAADQDPNEDNKSY